MNSKLWIRKALSTCMVIAVTATYSMVALANSEKIAGELTVTGMNVGGETSFVTVNGEAAKSGRSIFSSSTIVTPENAGAVVNLGKLGKVELAPKTTLAINFDNKAVNAHLVSGTVTVLGSSNGVNVSADGKTIKVNAGESVTTGSKAQDDDDAKTGGAAWWAWALIFGGAAAGILIATTSGNDINLGGNGTVVSPTR
jgi:hypothetical protein